MNETVPCYYYEDGLHVYEVHAKQRWFGRTLLDLFRIEFRDRSPEYYAHAIQTGMITLNGKVGVPDAIIKNGDLITNTVHRHEPPVIGDPVKIVFKDDAQGLLVVEKPGSMPVHTTGRYRYNTLLDILKHDYGYKQVYTANRLDKPTSGIMICSTNKDAAKRLGEIFSTEGEVQKQYVCRVVGCFPEEETVCEEPLLPIDRQLGLNVVHPQGRHAKTIFNRLSYHAPSNTSVVRCKPITGRTHQIRVHLQWLGYPIVNDPIYNHAIAWGSKKGKGGVFPAEHTQALEAMAIEKLTAAIEQSRLLERTVSPVWEKGNQQPSFANLRLPATEENLETGAAVDLTPELKTAILTLRKTRDEHDDFARYKDMERPPPLFSPSANDTEDATTVTITDYNQGAEDAHGRYCSLCGLPLVPDPKPAQLCIFLHAQKYSSRMGNWEFESTELPAWAQPDWLEWESAMKDIDSLLHM